MQYGLKVNWQGHIHIVSILELILYFMRLNQAVLENGLENKGPRTGFCQVAVNPVT